MRQKDTEGEREGERQRCRGINHESTMCQTKDTNVSCSPLGYRMKEAHERDARVEIP